MKKFLRMLTLILISVPMLCFVACDDSNEPSCAHANVSVVDMVAACIKKSQYLTLFCLFYYSKRLKFAFYFV